jgi:hypothetical protein
VAKKGLFYMDSGAEAAKLAPGGDNSMTGNEERHQIAPARLTNRASCPRPPKPSGDLPISGYVTGRNLPKASPDLELKGSSLEVHRMIEGAKLTGEVSLQRGNSRGQRATAFPEANGAMKVVEVSEYLVEFLRPEELAATDPLF